MARPADTLPQTLHGAEGDLVLLRISVEPRLLEALLDLLASLRFPVNPQLYRSTRLILVEFPAYAEQIKEVREALRRCGFNTNALAVAAPDGRVVHC